MFGLILLLLGLLVAVYAANRAHVLARSFELQILEANPWVARWRMAGLGGLLLFIIGFMERFGIASVLPALLIGLAAVVWANISLSTPSYGPVAETKAKALRRRKNP